jgi:hypothetical protein
MEIMSAWWVAAQVIAWGREKVSGGTEREGSGEGCLWGR